MVDLTQLFGQRDIQMQLWCLFWILIGDFAVYVAWKKLGSETPTITFAGAFKKLVIGLLCWGIFLSTMQGISNMGHLQVIIPALTYGVSAEVIAGAFLQQKIEASIAKETASVAEDTKDKPEEKKDDKKEEIKEVSSPKKEEKKA